MTAYDAALARWLYLEERDLPRFGTTHLIVVVLKSCRSSFSMGKIHAQSRGYITSLI
jgi:hypothetical protein